jgi:hypothetical protein
MSFREADPDMAAFIDTMRAEFGAAEITARIKEGMSGIPGRFHYKGPAGEVGTPAPPARIEISAADMQLGPFNPANKEPHANRNHRR